MPLWSRLANFLRGDHLNREIDEEFQSHIEEAIEQGRDPAEARKAFGSALRHREESRDIRLVAWLESLRADAVFGWRQLNKTRVTSLAAILSLALAIGACTSAFRLIDALLLRPLPVANAERLYDLSRQGIGPDNKPQTFDGWAYPDFQLMRAAVANQAELIAVSYAEPVDLTYKSDEEMEKAYLQYVSGWMFPTLGIRPALGRVFTENDDLKPGGHPYAVLSHDYWTHRFGQDPGVIGRTFRLGNTIYEIAGVAEAPFTGTEPGTIVDIFVPIMMHPGVTRKDWTWHRTLFMPKPGVLENDRTALESIRQKLQATFRAFEEERAKGFLGMRKEDIDHFLNQTLLLEPAATGVSALQSETRRPLAILGVLVALVLLIACANVANLMTAQASARAREMAVRVSIGGGRWRLVQLVLLQSAWLALLAAVLGGLFAWWSGPFVVSMINPPDNPARLLLPADWRVLSFGLALALGVTLLFGLAPALRASSVNPVSALKGGEDPHSRRRLMHALIAVQVSFCFLVLFVAGLFVTTFKRLSNQPTGFSVDRLLVLDTVAKQPQSLEFWEQVAERLRSVQGVEKVALADEPLLGAGSWNNFISVNGAPPNGILSYMRAVSPGWLETMKIPLIDGRDFLPSDAHPGSALVNETFAKVYFDGLDPVGKTFDLSFDEGVRLRYQIVGLVGDVRYKSLREPILPQLYVPFHSVDATGATVKKTNGTLLVRTSLSSPLALASTLRQEVPQVRSEFRVSRIRRQLEINQSHTVRERLLATLALFFAIVALLLAGVGLYGVLHYSVLQRRREIGIRIAVGAQAGGIARLVTRDVFSMVLFGAAAGVGLGMVSVRFIESLFYQVKATDLQMLALPALTILAGALLAALPAVIRAVRIDPVTMLRAE
ncbi:MAG TPA: ADOP family duplicated permease [Candidatus Limnocylindria bacterium]|jgi:predicted permease|nr:ADOP family duplicated permease [Candidatus Limnocylindria bacterium]